MIKLKPPILKVKPTSDKQLLCLSNFKMKLIPLSIVGLFALPAISFSQTSDEENSIDTGVSKTEMPITKQFISRSQLDVSIPQDGNDAVKDVAGASSNTSQGAPNPALSIRGLQL